jgi:hypothetical protein
MQGKIVSKWKLFESIPMHVQELNYKENIYELEDHVGEMAPNPNLSLKLGPAKQFLISFLSCLLENIWIKSMFFYALLPYHKWAKQNTIGVTTGISAKIPHHKGLMEDEKSFVHHVVEQ